MAKIKLFADPRHTMGTKMAVAFEVPSMADIETQLLAFSPRIKAFFLWKRFIEDIF